MGHVTVFNVHSRQAPSQDVAILNHHPSSLHRGSRISTRDSSADDNPPRVRRLPSKDEVGTVTRRRGKSLRKVLQTSEADLHNSQMPTWGDQLRRPETPRCRRPHVLRRARRMWGRNLYSAHDPSTDPATPSRSR